MLSLVFTLLALCAPAVGGGKAFLTVDEALELAFPDCKVERQTEFLSEEEEKRIEALAGSPLPSRIARPYLARRKGKIVGTAYFDAHRVRTKKEVLMLVVGPDERLRRVEVLAFAEPLEYLPKGSFYAQFVGQALEEGLELERDIRGIAGATLSAGAATAAARRTLAIHRILRERAQGERTADERVVSSDS